MLFPTLLACASSDLPGADDPLHDRPSVQVTSADQTHPPPDPEPPPATEPPFVARLTGDVVAGVFPLRVSFDATGSDRGAGPVRYEWSFGDGADAEGTARAAHTYVGEGAFRAKVTLVDESGAIASAEVTVEVATPGCPEPLPVVAWGNVEDESLEEISGVVASPTDPDAYWVQEDSGNGPVLTAIDRAGATLSQHELPEEFLDFEDLAAAVDPSTGVPMLFVGDIGDNGRSRDDITVWVAEEPHPRVDGPLAAMPMRLTYPDGARDVETLLVDPLTLDLYLVTKEGSGPASLFVKRAPHDAEGPFELEPLGERASLALTATGGDVSADGSRVVVRDYTETALLWMRDGYLPLEDAFDGEPCAIPIHDEPQGESIGFTADGAGLVTVSEGVGEPLYYIGL